MTLQEMRAALKDRNLLKVAEATGLHPATLYRLANGKVKPHRGTLRMLADYLQQSAPSQNS